MDAFSKVNRKFNDVFIKLFGGGAKLELVDSDDPLDAGLEMLVSPQAKDYSPLPYCQAESRLLPPYH